MAIENLLPLPLGTHDGSTIAGFKVLVAEGPTVKAYYSSGDTGTVRILNADGTTNPTQIDQAYWKYSEIVRPGDTSSVRTWRFAWPNTVNAASFKLWVFGPVPGEPSIPDEAPQGFTISADSVDVLYARARQVYEGPNYAGPFPPDVVLVSFRSGATVQEKQVALDLAGGSVIGGLGGIYYVHIPVSNPSTDQELATIIEKLEKLPQVEWASPDVTGNVGH